ncbi:MAG: hemerythrin family protein, partial [candidate division Zixibacteria bacterium]|nr:hemerythrin family protein [candidate division Zixibacteria bacterium]
EERLMERGKCQDLDHHRNLHKSLIERLIVIQRQYREGDDIDGLEVFLFLRDWLVDHVMSEDRKIGRALASQNKAGATK